jgi:hypothetical protein
MMMTLWWCGWFVLGSLLSNWFVRTRVVSSKDWYVVDNNVWRRGGERRAEFAKIDEDIAVSEKDRGTQPINELHDSEYRYAKYCAELSTWRNSVSSGKAAAG